jgi:hypothetical protein
VCPFLELPPIKHNAQFKIRWGHIYLCRIWYFRQNLIFIPSCCCYYLFVRLLLKILCSDCKLCKQKETDVVFYRIGIDIWMFSVDGFYTTTQKNLGWANKKSITLLNYFALIVSVKFALIMKRRMYKLLPSCPRKYWGNISPLEQGEFEFKLPRSRNNSSIDGFVSQDLPTMKLWDWLKNKD